MYRGIRLRIPDLPDQLNIDRYFSLRMFKSGIVLEGHVKKPNSTIVDDPRKPHKENYSVS